MSAVNIKAQTFETQNQKLMSQLLKLQKLKVTGTLKIETRLDANHLNNQILIFQNGQITYAGQQTSSPLGLAKKIGNKYKPHLVNVALGVAKQKLHSKSSVSVRELFSLLVKMRIFTWQEVENYVHNQVVLILEQLCSSPYELRFNRSVKFDLSFGDDCHGIDISTILTNIKARQQDLHLLNSVDINHSPKEDESTVSGQKVTTPVLISTPSNSFVSTSHLPTVLTVDDSSTVHNFVRLALEDRYNILIANNAVEGLKILNQQSVDLMLLDVNMPGIDGLKMCKTLRGISKFKNLPIIMLTGQNTRVDKIKGQIAGTSHYINKPFNNEELISVVNHYINQDSLSEIA